MTPEAEVIAAAEARANALANADAETLTALLHPDFRWTAHSGASFDRTAYVARNTDGTTRWVSQDLGDPVVVLGDDTAALHTVVTDVVAGDHGNETFLMPMTQVWVGSPEGWVCTGGRAGPRLSQDAGAVGGNPLVVVTGLPASGKSTAGGQLAEALDLPILDKDDILESLFDALGSPTPAARERLSRAADDVLLALLAAMPAAVVVSWWNEDSLTRLRQLGRPLVEVHCECPMEIALTRFDSRVRHPGHHDHRVSSQEREGRTAALRAAWRGPHRLGPLVLADTSTDVNVDVVAQRARAHL